MLCPLPDDRGVSSFIIGPGDRLRVPGPVLWSSQGPCFDRGGLASRRCRRRCGPGVRGRLRSRPQRRMVTTYAEKSFSQLGKSFLQHSFVFNSSTLSIIPVVSNTPRKIILSIFSKAYLHYVAVEALP